MLSMPGAPPLVSAPGALPVRSVAAYGVPGGYSPAFSANLRAAAWVLLRSRASVWHFVFAPNPRTSQASRLMQRVRRVPVVQTVASPPRNFQNPQSLFFGDVLVAQSSWTKRSIETSYEASGLRAPRVALIAPPVPSVLVPTAAEIASVRRELGLQPEQRYVLYPGDLETSSGALSTAAIAERLPSSHGSVVTVFAYRNKSPRAAQVRAQLAQRLPIAHVRFIENAPHILALLAGAEVVLFPVDDLWGKVDLPIVLLEAMALGVPVAVLDQGPLSDLGGAVKVSTLAVDEWLRALAALLDEPSHRARTVDLQRQSLEQRHQARFVARAYEDLYLELLG